MVKRAFVFIGGLVGSLEVLDVLDYFFIEGLVLFVQSFAAAKPFDFQFEVLDLLLFIGELL
jgi:hypothetical protein